MIEAGDKWAEMLNVKAAEVKYTTDEGLMFKEAGYEDHADEEDASTGKDIIATQGNIPLIVKAWGPGSLRDETDHWIQGENVIFFVEIMAPSSYGDILCVDFEDARKADHQIRLRANSCPITGIVATVLLSAIGPFVRPYFWISDVNMNDGTINITADGNNKASG